MEEAISLFRIILPFLSCFHNLHFSLLDGCRLNAKQFSSETLVLPYGSVEDFLSEKKGRFIIS